MRHLINMLCCSCDYKPHSISANHGHLGDGSFQVKLCQFNGTVINPFHMSLKLINCDQIQCGTSTKDVGALTKSDSQLRARALITQQAGTS